MAKWGAELRRRRPGSRAGVARLPRGDERRAGPGGAGAAARHADRADRRGRRRGGRGGAERARLAALLGEAASPLVVLGGSGWDAAARQAVTGFAERFELPVATGF